jgi:hypothetical protein
MLSPESGLNPVILPEVKVAVQENIVPTTFDVNEIFVDSPEQIYLERGLFVTEGMGVVINCIVSVPLQPLEFVTITSYVPDWPVLYV